MTAEQLAAVDELRTKLDKPKLNGGYVRAIALSPATARALLAMIDTSPT